ncbi:class I SAM-dependent methyltransferase [Nocardioides solisilvae]|uniref:class I SAM-dependent methyltransferase n=1 Tax=Nocardioides solisilvae TaxID=1542435 RepID=UPI0013A55180|nr:methyltransferase domain-containing protein [Nocardioides solisilvae]
MTAAPSPAAPSSAVPWDDPATRDRFRAIADRLIALANPKTTLDLGCGPGLLVQALAEKGVDAHGVDADEAALGAAHPEVRDRLEARPWSRVVPGRHDLVSCLDVVDRLEPLAAQALIDAVCSATDRVLFSSSPDAFGEPGRLNVHPVQDWAAAFAEQGFYRRTDVNLELVADHAVLFERADLQPRDVVHRYEATLAPMVQELRERREALARLERDGDARAEVARLREQLRRAQHDVLTTRDHIIGLEAEATQAQLSVARLEGRLKVQQSRLRKLRGRLAEQQRRARRLERTLEQVRVSRAWRLGRRLTRTTTPEL